MSFSGLYDEIFLHPPNGPCPHEKRFLVFLITGNPGLIEYYRDFLVHLYHELLPQKANVYLYGTSLSGFSITEDHRPGLGQLAELRKGPFALDEQIEHVTYRISYAIRKVHFNENDQTSPLPVILIGHSVGSYILMEILSRWQTMPKPSLDNVVATTTGSEARKDSAASPTEIVGSRNGSGSSAMAPYRRVSELHEQGQSNRWSNDGSRKGKKTWEEMVGPSPATPMQLAGGICLFPTIVDIAKSPRGRMMSPLLQLPGFARIIHWLGILLFGLCPPIILALVVRVLTFMPWRAAQVTTMFIQSEMGLRQALYMAKCEMQQLTNDKWSDELWGVPASQALQAAAASAMTETGTKESTAGGSLSGTRNKLAASPRLYFYWGEKDHWVANSTRDAAIRARANRGGLDDANKPHMEIDRKGVPHHFCLRHNEVIAEKVAQYVREMADSW